MRNSTKDLIRKENSKIEVNDRDYIFLYFIINYLPNGLIGLLLAVIISAAMSSTASELNALSATTVVDIYKEINHKKDHKTLCIRFKMVYSNVGLIAIMFANFGTLFENLIQLVNIIGSIFMEQFWNILVAFFSKELKVTTFFGQHVPHKF